ncbi:MAG: hypothetical protein ACREP9_01565 [Candidatus Dormibacteraceae bacterium]
MNRISKRALAGVTAILFAVAAVPLCSAQEDHVVSTSQIQQKVVQAAHARQKNLETVRGFFASPQAQKALKKAKVNYSEVQKAIPTLSDPELAQLAARATQAQQNFAAGALNNEQITYIIIALATAVVVILIVKA